MKAEYKPRDIEKKWQSQWEKSHIFEVKEDKKRKKFYCLEMYPYPSGSGLHMGHARNYAIGDCFARFKRMQGFNVLYPMGYDSFGLPAENAAIKEGIHPKKYTEQAIKNFISQQKSLGLSYDWSRIIASHMPEYYKWDQWIFLNLLEKGLAYRKKAFVNFCSQCNTVLANEQVVQGKCWRHEDQKIQIKELEQWFFKITQYADELLRDIEKLKGWEEDVKAMQRNWIGKSEGTEINFRIKGTNEIIPIFTTRADTLYGVTFMVFAPEHPLIARWVKGTKYEKEFLKFKREIEKEDKFERTSAEIEKKGLFIGKYAINPVNGKEVPCYVGNFVIYEYGAGAVMAVPAHDQRDFEFAKKYKLPIKVVISPPNFTLRPEKMARAYTSDGTLINSGQFNGANNRDIIEDISKHLEKKKLGKRTVHYKLRDWLISRQRYWGCPIPIIYCNNCGIVPVPEKNLPVLLPEKVDFRTGGNPLSTNKEFVNVKCPKCGKAAKRETDTMDVFVDSSWYFLRYCDAKNAREIFSKEKVIYWMPIDQYIGGKEHATGHLIYFRFFTKFLRDLGLLKVDEPAPNLFNQGMLHKGGVVMSKSKGNVVTQEEIESKYGVDTARFFLLFVASPGKDMEWSDLEIEGSFRFINKFYRLLENTGSKSSRAVESRLNRLVNEVTEHIENFEFNLVLVKIVEFVNYLSKSQYTKKDLEMLTSLLSPFIPHVCEEVWHKLGNKSFASLERWPSSNEKKIDLELEEQENIIEKTREDLINVLKLVKIAKPKEVILYVASDWKYSLYKRVKHEVERGNRNVSDIIKQLTREKEFKGNESEIARLVQNLIKDPSKISSVILNEKEEAEALKNSIKMFEKEFKFKFKVEKDNGKAFPGKPGILVG